jgi:hypothetical protein
VDGLVHGVCDAGLMTLWRTRLAKGGMILSLINGILKNIEKWWRKQMEPVLRTKMLTLFRALLIVLSLATSAEAMTITLGWDGPSCLSCSVENPCVINGVTYTAPCQVDGYKLFWRHEGQSYNYGAPAWQGTALTGSISGLTDQRTYFVVRAYNSKEESGDSNEAIYALSANAPSSLTIASNTTSSPYQVSLAITGPSVVNFNLPVAGKVTLTGSVWAPTDGNNSFYIDMDNDPGTDETKAWHLDINTGYASQTARWGTYDNPSAYADPKVWTLAAGNHVLYLRQRESGTLIQSAVLNVTP